MNNRNKMKRRNSEVFEAFKMFDRDGDGKVSWIICLSSIISIYHNMEIKRSILVFEMHSLIGDIKWFAAYTIKIRRHWSSKTIPDEGDSAKGHQRQITNHHLWCKYICGKWNKFQSNYTQEYTSPTKISPIFVLFFRSFQHYGSNSRG